MLLRAAVTDDLEALLSLAIAFYKEDNFSASESDLHTNLSKIIPSPVARVAVSEIGGRIIAFAITTTVFGLEGGLMAELEDLYVAPDARKQGVAERLIEDAARWALEQGCKHMQVVIAPNGQDVSHLFAYYGKRGFRDAGRRLLSRSLCG
ncbi:GNAT family N-acetyltransferase [Streptomyces sp. NPDC002306]